MIKFFDTYVDCNGHKHYGISYWDNASGVIYRFNDLIQKGKVCA